MTHFRRVHGSNHYRVLFVSASVAGVARIAGEEISDEANSVAWGPPFLECEGPEFGPEWLRFRNDLLLKAPGLRGPGVLDADLARQAADLLAIWGSVSQNVVHHLQLFALRLAGATSENVPLSNFCLYGLVAAHFVLARRTHRLATGDSADDELPMEKTAKSELMPGLMLLAKKMSHDFLESTRWPFRSIDLLMAAQSADVKSFRYYTDEFSLPCQLRLGCEQAQHTAEANIPQGVSEMFSNILAVGMHTTSTLEAATALRDAVHEMAIAEFGHAADLELHYAGHPCPTHSNNAHHCAMRCELLGNCEGDGDDAIAEFIMHLVDVATFEEREYTMSEAESAFNSLIPRFKHVANSGIIVCTFPTVLCLLLHKAFPAIPMLFVAISNPLYMAPGCVWEEDTTTRQCLGDETRGFLAAFRMMLQGGVHWAQADAAMGGESLVAGLAAYAVTSVLTHFQTGVWLPLAGKAGRYMPSSAKWQMIRPDAVLLTRSRFYDTSWGPYFLTVLRESALMHKSPLEFVLQHEVGGLLSYDDIASYRASVILPQDLGLHKFTEHYAMSAPIWMPSFSMAWRLQMHVPWGMVSYSSGTWVRAGHNIDLPRQREARHGGFEKFTLDFPPWFNAQKSPLDEVAYWYAFSEFVAYPHVQVFDALPQLTLDVLSADLFTISAGMRRFRGRLWKTTRAVYVGAMRRLLLATSAEMG